jgi:hypothetical protein
MTHSSLSIDAHKMMPKNKNQFLVKNLVSDPIRIVDRQDQEFFNRRINKSFKEIETLTISRPLKKITRDLALIKKFESRNSPLDSLGVSDNTIILEALQEINKHIPDKLRELLFASGFDIKAIVDQSMQIPEHTKAIKSCDFVINTLKSDPLFPKITGPYNLSEQTLEVNEKLLRKLKSDLENELMDTPKDFIPFSKENLKKMEHIEKIYQYDLAKNFKKVNLHNLKKDLSEVGINSIKVSGNAFYIFMNNEIGRVLKITANVGSIVINVLDNVWKVNHFKIDTPENDYLTPLDLFNKEKSLKRRDQLVNQNIDLMNSMVKYLNKKRFNNPEKFQIVSALLRGFGCDPQAILENLEDKELTKTILKDTMMVKYHL